MSRTHGRRKLTRTQRRTQQATAHTSRTQHSRIAAAALRGDNSGTPLQLHPQATLATLRAAITRRFGPGEVVLGITGTGKHPGIHRSTLSSPLRTHCGQVSHGVPRLMQQVVAVTDDPRPYAVIELLTAAGIEACRMCSRCWTSARLPHHDPNRCFRKPAPARAVPAVQA